MLTPSGKDQSTLVEVSRRPWDKIYKKEKELLKRYTAIRNQLKQLDLLPYKKGKAQHSLGTSTLSPRKSYLDITNP